MGALFALLLLGFLYTRMGGGDEADLVALPSLDDSIEDEFDGFDDFDDDLIGEPTDEDLELTELASDADDEMFDVESGPEADGIDPLTGRINDGDDLDGVDVVDGGELDPTEADLFSDVAGEDPEGPAAFVDEGAPVISGNQIDTGLDGREGVIIVDGDSGRDDGVIVVDGDGRNDGVIVVDGDGRNDGVIVVDGDGRNDGVIVVDADGYSFADDDPAVIVIDGDGIDRGDAEGTFEVEVPNLSSEPPTPVFDEAAPEPEAAPESNVSMAELANVAAAEALLTEWLGTEDVSGARVGFSFADGSRTYLIAGTENDGGELDIDREFMATSITKTMTASLVFNLVSEGVFELDATAPALGAVPDFGHTDQFTIRQLLQHTSGLAPYQSAPEWSQDMELNALTALQLADNVPLENEPGAERGYSNSGYLYLGLLSEQYTATPFHELIRNRIAEPLGLEATRIDGARRPGWVGYSAGGLISNVPDLLTWGSALYREGTVLEQDQLDSMLDVNNEHSTGLGANVICPCGMRDGNLWYTSIGHDGGSVTLQYSPADDMVTSAKFTESFWTDDLTQREVHKLLRELRAALVPE